MRRDARLSTALHVLLHLSDAKRPMTSDALGPLLNRHPVVLRRTFACLRKAGILLSEKGHGGGWSLARPLRRVSLGDVYAALGISAPFTLDYRTRSPRCLLERAANRALTGALNEAEALLEKRLQAISLGDVLQKATRTKSGQ